MSKPETIPLGPAVIDVAGTALGDEDIRRLSHPLTGGVILFARNYESPEQLSALTAAIHAVRDPALLIAVDHEGGRVQRFREGFTRLPPMRALGQAWDRDRDHARDLARQVGFVLAAELRAHGIDLSFAPVLDLDHGGSSVIGDRAFHRDAAPVAELAAALIEGLGRGGLAAVGKHFPGHGYVRADSHLELPRDERTYEEIERADLVPFSRLIDAGLTAVMPAHVVYEAVDSRPAGFSEVWLKRILREKLGFDGIVFSDDLSMEGARSAGGIAQRVRSALGAGCDMVLVCNDANAVDELYRDFEWDTPAVTRTRLERLHGRGAALTIAALRGDPGYTESVRAIGELPDAAEPRRA